MHNTGFKLLALAAASRFNNDIQVVTAAVKQNGLALKFASGILKANHTICSIACANNPEAAQFRDKETLKLYRLIAEISVQDRRKGPIPSIKQRALNIALQYL